MENKKVADASKLVESLKESLLDTIALRIDKTETLLKNANNKAYETIINTMNDIQDEPCEMLIDLLTIHQSSIDRIHYSIISLKYAFEEISKIKLCKEYSMLSMLHEAQKETNQSIAIIIEKVDKKVNLGEHKHNILKELQYLSLEEQDGK